MKKWWLGLIIGLIILSSGIYWGLIVNDGATADHSPDPSSQQEEEQVPQKEVSKAEVTFTSGDQTIKLIAEEMVQFNEAKLDLKQVVIKVFKGADNKQLQATLTAPQGSYWPDEGRLKFFSPVNIKNNEVKIKADSLRWNQQQNRWIGEGNVVIIHYLQEVKLTGDSFVADIDLDKLQVKGNVRLIQHKPKVGEIDAAKEEQ